MAFSPDEKSFEIHRLANNSFSEIVTVAERAVTEIIFSQDEKNILTSNSQGELKIWDVKTGSLLHRLERRLGKFAALAFSYDGRHIFTTQDDGLLEVWNTLSGDRERTIHLDSTYKNTDDYDRLDRMAVSKSGDTVFIYFCNSKIAVVNFLNQTIEYVTGFTDHGVGGMAFDGTNGRLFLCGWDGYVRSFQPIPNKSAYAESAIKISGSSLTHLSVSDSNNLLLISNNLFIYIVNTLNGNSTIIYEADSYGDIWEICSSSDLSKILIRETTDEGERILKLLTVTD